MQEEQAELPMLREPHDTMRLGLSSLKEDVSTSHPVEAIQKQVRHQTISGLM